MEDVPRWKTILYGRGPSIEDNLWWKTTFHGRDIRWKTTFHGRQPSMEDDLRWKTTFDGRRLDRRRPLMKDVLRHKTIFDGRPPLMEDNRVFPTAALCVAVRHFSKEFWEIYFCNSFKASIQGVKQRLDSKSLSRSMFLEILQEYVQERVPEMFPGMQFLKRYNPPKLS